MTISYEEGLAEPNINCNSFAVVSKMNDMLTVCVSFCKIYAGNKKPYGANIKKYKAKFGREKCKNLHQVPSFPSR